MDDNTLNQRYIQFGDMISHFIRHASFAVEPVPLRLKQLNRIAELLSVTIAALASVVEAQKLVGHHYEGHEVFDDALHELVCKTQDVILGIRFGEEADAFKRWLDGE